MGGAPSLIEEIASLQTACAESAAETLTDTLNSLKRVLGAAQELTDALEDSKYFRDKSDVDDAILRLMEYHDLPSESTLAKRIKKEVREFNEMKSHLPGRSERKRDKGLRKAIARLEASAPSCTLRNCGSKMTIREGNGEFFWGCSTFPTCWGALVI